MPILMRSVFLRPVLALAVLMLGGCLVSLIKSPAQILTPLQDQAPRNLRERSPPSDSAEKLGASRDVRYDASDLVAHCGDLELKSGVSKCKGKRSVSDSSDLGGTFSSSKLDGEIYHEGSSAREHVSSARNETKDQRRRYKRDAAADQEELDSSTLRVWVTPFHLQGAQGASPARSEDGTHSYSSEDEPFTLMDEHSDPNASERLLTRGFEWVAWGRLWQIVAWHDSHFLAPSLLLREEGRARSRVQPSNGIARCFFKGYVIGHRHSSDVALSACDGLSGVIRVGGDIYFLEPLKLDNDLLEPNEQQSLSHEDSLSRISAASLATLGRGDTAPTNFVHSSLPGNSSNERNSGVVSMSNNEASSEDYTVEEEVRNKLRRLARLDTIRTSEKENSAKEEDEEEEETYLPDGHYTIFGEDPVPPPRLHIFRKAGLGSGSASGHSISRAKRSTGEESNSEGFTRTLSDNALLDLRKSSSSKNNSELSDSEKLLQSASKKQNTLHVCDTTGSSYVETTDETLTENISSPPEHHRSKRFLFSKPYTMEILLVVDAKMARYHGRHVDQYVLTLMSMVSLIYRDSSLGNLIDIAVVEVVHPEGKTFASKKSSTSNDELAGKSAEDMLKDFCKWQRHGLKQNPSHPRRFDTALLLTRENICRNPYTQNCDTLGLAELGTMCSRHASCAIVQDNGLSAAFTIAHELGHLLNMPHDNDAKCKILKGSTSEDASTAVHMNVMSRMLDHNTLPWIWSNCSRHYLTEYLYAGHARCLEDSASSNKLVEDEVELTLAGELFNATKQCQYVFGKTTSICPYMPKCKRLWCTTSLDEKEGCKTQHMPWADGTPCGSGYWCLRGECVPRNRNTLKKIQGQWGDWQPWSACSRTCGVGVIRSERYCDAPKPKFGGRYCVGEKVRYKSCIMEPCPRGAIAQDFRTQQCQSYNGKNFGLPDIPEEVKWIPKYAGISHEDSCKLFCQVSNSSVYYQLREKVDDGTTCGPDTYDICVNGKCRVAGCDYVLNSTTRDDFCGVCGGDNSTCQISTGSLEDSQSWGYSDVTIIPEGAARVQITQRAFHDKADDDNYLALVDLETGEYLLNGHWIVTPFQKVVEFAGTMLEYTGSNTAIERINSTKPLQKKLLVQILSVGKLHPPYIRYSYTKSNLLSDPSYFWRLDDWTNCTQPCMGTRERSAYCMSADGRRVAEYLCAHNTRPTSLTESCALTCPVSWKYREWSPCRIRENGECGKQRAVAACVTTSGNEVDHERCRTDGQPVTQERCSPTDCPEWKYHEWAPCSCVTGTTEGNQQRLYWCELRGVAIQPWKCKGLHKPEHIRNCSCWHAQPWDQWCAINGETPSTQLELRQLEEVFSITRYSDPRRSLNRSTESSSRSRGITDVEIDTETIRGNPIVLRSLDGRCGRGMRRRVVVCGNPSAPKPEQMCDVATKPPEVAPCSIPCPTSTSTTTSTTTTTTTTTPEPLTRLDNDEETLHSGETYYSKRQNSFNPTQHQNQWDPQRRHHADRKKGGGGRLRHEPVRPPEETNEIGDILPPRIANNNGRYGNTARLPPPNSDAVDNRDGKDDIEINSSNDPRKNLVDEDSNGLLLKGTLDNVQNAKSEWQVGAWGRCSVDCGGGEMRRLVACGGRWPTDCPARLRPPDTEPCNTHICSEWTVGDWGRCLLPRKRSCGRGRRRREVICRDRHSSQTLPPSDCLPEDKPQNISSCRVACKSPRRHHYRYKWRRGPWSGCSETCDQGEMIRNVTCLDKLARGRGSSTKGMAVNEEYCIRQGLTKPRESRHCNKNPCAYRWLSGAWSECSARCGPGRQERSVTCHAVSPLNWVDPDPAPSGCKPRRRPPSTRSCNMGECSRGFFWIVKPWKACQAVCGERGRQRRRVMCLDARGNRVRATRCSREARPRRKQRCQAPPCGITSCKQARDVLRLNLDGEYALLVGGVNVSIYCLGMNVSEPREYLSLPAGEEGNFAEIYSKRLIRPDTCPNGGRRHRECACMQDESGRAGLTTFSRIRLNVTTLSVNMYDFTFAFAVDGRQVAYGEAGDCYSMAQCPQGAFSINLVGTSFKVSDRTTWVGYGNKAAHWINRLDDSQRILGRCGGYCGTCAPDPKIGLKLDIRTPTP